MNTCWWLSMLELTLCRQRPHGHLVARGNGEENESEGERRQLDSERNQSAQKANIEKKNNKKQMPPIAKSLKPNTVRHC